MKLINLERKLTEEGFVVKETTENSVIVSIWDDVEHHENCVEKTAHNVVFPLSVFCSKRSLMMRRTGGTVEVFAGINL